MGVVRVMVGLGEGAMEVAAVAVVAKAAAAREVVQEERVVGRATEVVGREKVGEVRAV